MPAAILNVFSIRFARSLVFVFALIAATAVSSLVASGAEPFQSRVTANWDNIFAALPVAVGGPGLVANFAGISQTSHLGRAGQRGTLTLQAPVGPGIFPGSGSVTITGANGDRLTLNYTGNLYANTGEGQGAFTFTGGTGRFAHATGNGTFYAQIDLRQPTNQPMIVVLDGTIAY